MMTFFEDPELERLIAKARGGNSAAGIEIRAYGRRGVNALERAIKTCKPEEVYPLFAATTKQGDLALNVLAKGLDRFRDPFWGYRAISFMDEGDVIHLAQTLYRGNRREREHAIRILGILGKNRISLGSEIRAKERRQAVKILLQDLAFANGSVPIVYLKFYPQEAANQIADLVKSKSIDPNLEPRYVRVLTGQTSPKSRSLLQNFLKSRSPATRQAAKYALSYHDRLLKRRSSR